MKAKWQRKLTKKEIKHIKETTDRGTLIEFKRNHIQHEIWREEFPENSDPCRECREIAKKLNF